MVGCPKPSKLCHLSPRKVWNVETANLTAQDYTSLNVKILAAKQLIDIKLLHIIGKVVFYLHVKFWVNLIYS